MLACITHRLQKHFLISCTDREIWWGNLEKTIWRHSIKKRARRKYVNRTQEATSLTTVIITQYDVGETLKNPSQLSGVRIRVFHENPHMCVHQCVNSGTLHICWWLLKGSCSCLWKHLDVCLLCSIQTSMRSHLRHSASLLDYHYRVFYDMVSLTGL